jgi:hypothetical protein
VYLLILFFAALLITISVSMFGYNADVNRQWLPNPDSNFLSWSFGFCILSGFFSIFAGLCLGADWMVAKEEEARRNRPAAYAPKANPTF